MANKYWSTHPILKDWRGNKAVQLGKDWDSLVRSGQAAEDEIQRIITTLKPLMEALVLRFTPESNFLDAGRVLKLPPNYYEEVACIHPDEWTAKLDQDRQEEDRKYALSEATRRRDHIAKYGNDKDYTPSVNEGVAFHYRSRLYASFPFLIDMREQNGESLRFTESEWKEKAKEDTWVDDKEPYYKYIHQIAASSGKLTMIKKKIDEWDEFIDGEGLPARLIFCSFFFVGARIIYLVGFPTRANNTNSL